MNYKSPRIDFEGSRWKAQPAGDGYVLTHLFLYTRALYDTQTDYFDHLRNHLKENSNGHVINVQQIFITGETMTWIQLSPPKKRNWNDFYEEEGPF